MENETIRVSQQDLMFVSDVLSSGEDFYKAYDRMLPYLESGTDRYFWFEQASIINQQATETQPPSENNLSSTYIIAHSGYGLALDGFRNDLGVTSSAIAARVLNEIIDNEGVIPLDDMIANDISAALDEGNQTIGGWGGSFYYWDRIFDGSTIGQQILGSPQELEKFLLSSAVATLAVARQELSETPSFSEVLTVLDTAAGSTLPFEMKLEIVKLVLDGLASGNITQDTDSYGVWTYDRGADEFYQVYPPGTAGAGERIVAVGAEDEFLRARQDYRFNVAVKDLDYIDEVLARLGFIDQIPVGSRCFDAGTLIDMWPLDCRAGQSPIGIYDQPLVRAQIWRKPIEDVKAGDIVGFCRKPKNTAQLRG